MVVGGLVLFRFSFGFRIWIEALGREFGLTRDVSKEFFYVSMGPYSKVLCLVREVIHVKNLLSFGHRAFGGGGQTHVQKNLDCFFWD